MATHFKRNERIVERNIRGERILVPVSGTAEALDSIYTLNGTAGEIWDLACKGKTPAEIAETLASTYSVEAAQAESDTAEILGQLLEIGALEAMED